MTKIIASKDITETLASAMEYADRFSKVIVIGETVEGDELSQILIMSGNTNLAEANYLMDLVKMHCLTVPRDEFTADQEEEDDSSTP